MNTDHDITLVEKYFDQELTDAEAQEFNIRLNTDTTFKALVDQEKVLIKGIHLEGLTRDLRYLQSVERTLGQKPSIGLHWPGKKWHYAAAAAVVFFVASVGLWIYTSQNTSDQLFTAYFDKPYTNIFESGKRGVAADVPQPREAFRAYDRGDYAQAAKLLSELLTTEKNPEMVPGILMLLGNSNLMIGNTDEATKNFSTLINNFDELDLPAKWYLSLCYLKSGDVENARKVLKELGETEVSYATKAKELLNKVD